MVVETLSSASPLAQALVGLLVLAVVLLVGRIALSIAWKAVIVAAAIVGVLYAVTLFPV